MKPRHQIALIVVTIASEALLSADPRISSWYTEGSRNYARLYTDSAAEQSGTSVTTWDRGNGVQNTPAYAGIQSIQTSADWIYISTTGLGYHVMGPWYLDAADRQDFPNFPGNTATTFRLPRNPNAATQAQATGAGAIGYFVDGVALFDNRDTFSYQNSSQTDGSPVNGVRGDGVWNRDAFVNEGVTFDAAFAHQAGAQYHYHANPPALRHQLGDHVDYDAATNTYSERTTPPEHSPILAWVSDGYPLYGPYGYGEAMNPESGVRRMASGFQKRDGTNGTDDLRTQGRTRLPQWAANAQGRDRDLPATLIGPAVSNEIILGHYLEDYAYLGDLGLVQGSDYDLDEHNGRFCVTPEFPEGTYAYFVAIEPDGTPTYPYNLGRTFYGNPTGGAVNGAINEPVTAVFSGGPESTLNLTQITASNDEVELTWTSVEGGAYQVEATSDFDTWASLSDNRESEGARTGLKTSSANQAQQFYRVTLTDLAPYDAEGNAGGNQAQPNDPGMNPGQGGQSPTGVTGGSVEPNSAARGSQAVVVTIVLNANTTPPLPPEMVQPNAVRFGPYTASAIARTGITLQVTLSIPADATSGPLDITISFPGPGGQAGPSYTFENAFSID